MNPSPLSLTGTRAFGAVRLRRMLLNPVVLPLLFAFLLVPAGILSLREGGIVPFALTAAGLGFLLHVFHTFVHEKLLDDALDTDPGDPATSLAAELVVRIGKKNASGDDLFRAAVFSPRGRFLLREINLDPHAFYAACVTDVERAVDSRSFLADARGHVSPGETRVDGPLILSLFFTYIPACRDALEQAGMPLEDLKELLRWEAFHHRFRRHANPFSVAGLRAFSIGRSWVSGYTLALDALTQEMPQEAAEAGERSVAIHQQRIQAFLHVLCRGSGRNVLLVGPIGVGKKRMTENALCTLRTLEREQNLPFSRALLLCTEQLLSGTGDPDGAFLRALYKAQGGGRIILVIRDLALLLKASEARLQTVLLRCLQMPNLSVVGIVDTQEYHGTVKVHPEIDSLFEKIEVEPSDEDETMQILMAKTFTAPHGTSRLPYAAARSIIQLSKRFLSARGGFPSVPLQVYDDACAHAREREDVVVCEEDVRAAVSLKAKMNVRQMTEGERGKLLKLEEALTAKIIGQETAVAAVANALKRAKLDLHERKKPLGTFLFLGPTGVGKTHTAQVLAEEYFGSADAMIRLDMNEFSHAASVFDIVGSSSAGSGEGYLAQRVQDKPFSLILLDEIEKAHPSVLNLFLQVLDEGMLTDARGVKTSFRNAIIIATSNAGALFIRDAVRAQPRPDSITLKNALVEHILRDGIFTPEFLNRFDEVIVYQPLAPATVKTIASIILTNVLQEIRRKRGIQVEVAPELLDLLIEKGYSMEFGARELLRTVTQKVENQLANYLLAHDVKRGEKLVLR